MSHLHLESSDSNLLYLLGIKNNNNCILYEVFGNNIVDKIHEFYQRHNKIQP